MKQHIDTVPIWEAFRKDAECPLCALRQKVEESNVNYFLGESVMEPNQRIEVNQKGFCAHHFYKLYAAGNRLPLGLMTHTYMKETLRILKSNAEDIKMAASTEAGKSVFKRMGSKKGAGLSQTAGKIKEVINTCVLCERLKSNMDRYLYTLLYMYRHESGFPELFAQSKGMCLPHYHATLVAASEHLTGDVLKHFVDTLVEIEMQNLERLEGEIEWFTLKFDYKNADKPWGNSKDAVKRTINKLRENAIE
ncbi:MAG: DUF6062 family protein [Christensenellales bacterium]|nr:DUF6062 family protein [Christensenellales bacterium]